MMAEEIKRNLDEVLRDELVMRDRILQLLRDGPKTVLEIADALKYPSHEVMLWLATMWRYGSIEETGKANSEGYFQYKPKEQ